MVVYRYASITEETIAARNGYVPNIDPIGQPKDVYFTPYLFRSRVVAELRLQIGEFNPGGASKQPEVRMNAQLSGSEVARAGSVVGGDAIEVITRRPVRLVSSVGINP